MTAAAILALLVIALALAAGMIGAAIAGQVSAALAYLGLVVVCCLLAWVLRVGGAKG